MAKPLTIKKARLAALRGEIDIAIDALGKFSDNGDDSACASLVDLLAFRGEWDECIPNTARFIANPSAAYAGNVFDDMVRVLGRAGHETRKWGLIESSCINAIARIELASFQKWERNRYCTILNNLISYAARNGTAPHELLRVFGVQSFQDGLEPEQLELMYQEAVKKVYSLRPDLKGHPEELAVHQFGLAELFSQEDEAINIYTESKRLLSFNNAVYVAKALLIRNKPESAWEIVEEKISHWWPVDAVQVAPLVLVTDEHIKEIMTKDRCERVIKSARGSEFKTGD